MLPDSKVTQSYDYTRFKSHTKYEACLVPRAVSEKHQTPVCHCQHTSINYVLTSLRSPSLHRLSSTQTLTFYDVIYYTRIVE